MDKINNIEEDVIHFQLNNWSLGKDYPDEEPFISWMGNNLKFLDKAWVRKNKL